MDCSRATNVFFNDTATTEIYTLSLHDALPISAAHLTGQPLLNLDDPTTRLLRFGLMADHDRTDRKSTRLNSSHSQISYAVFCLKKQTYYHNLHFNLYTCYNLISRPLIHTSHKF